ncbi:MAG: hypothetical protein MHPSP_003766, partial [Paramarteilia canceri]
MSGMIRRSLSNSRIRSEHYRKKPDKSNKKKQLFYIVSTGVTSLKCVLTDESLNSNVKLRYYKNIRNACEELLDIKESKELNEKEEKNLDIYKNKLNEISESMRDKGIMSCVSARKSGNIKTMLKTAILTENTGRAIRSKKLINYSQKLRNFVERIKRNEPKAQISLEITKIMCERLNNDINNLKLIDKRNSKYIERYALIRNRVMRMRHLDALGKFGSNEKSQLIKEQIKNYENLTSEIMAFYRKRLRQYRKSSSERKKRIISNSYTLCDALEDCIDFHGEIERAMTGRKLP